MDFSGFQHYTHQKGVGGKFTEDTIVPHLAINAKNQSESARRAMFQCGLTADFWRKN